MKGHEFYYFLFVSISLYPIVMVNGNGIKQNSTRTVSASNSQAAATTAKPKQTNKNKNTCFIPKEGPDRNYTIKCPSQTPCLFGKSSNIASSNTILHIKCQSGFLAGENFQKKAICLDGEWLPAIVACEKSCKKKAPPGTDITCTYNDRKVDCNGNLKVGTKITSRCKPEYVENGSNNAYIVCKENGQWSGVLPTCIPACGKPFANVTLLLTDGDNATYGDSPWHVGIYVKNTYQKEESFDLICGGTIITPYLILSAGHCFYDDIQNKVRTPRDYEAVTSKYSRNYSIRDNEMTKSYAIRNISFPEINVLGNRNAFQLNVALLEVENKITLSPTVLPACLPWDKTSTSFSTLAEGTPLKVSGWGVDNSDEVSDFLKTCRINYITRDTCIAKAAEELQADYNKWLINYLSPDKLCAGNKTGPRISPGDNGGGLLYQDKSNFLHYLLGVVGHKENLGTTSIVAFTNVLFYIDWIKRVRNEVDLRRENNNESVTTEREVLPNEQSEELIIEISEPSIPQQRTEVIATQSTQFTNCTIPDSSVYNFDYELVCPKKLYSESECQNLTKSSTMAPEYSDLSMRCFKGYIPDINQELESVCLKASWRPALKPCKKICRKLRSKNVLLKCTYQETNVDCDHDLRSGTKVSAECIPEYRPDFTPDYAEITCGDDGEWNAGLFRCKPACGRATADNVTGLIYGGHSAKFGELPWHVAIYDRTKKYPIDLICGGTIITEYIILSAAHCFYDRDNRIMRDAKDYEVIVGKITRDREILDSEITRIYKVKKIYVNNFHGILLRYQNDIAILEMETKIIFNPYVIPACLDYTKNVIISSGNRMKVAGWGEDESHKPSTILKVTELPFFSVNECINKAPPEMVDFFSSDKFCVGNVTGDSVTKGDSGGGLFHLVNSLYYISGIVSFKSTAMSSFAVITNVNFHSDWIRSTKNEIHASRLE